MESCYVMESLESYHTVALKSYQTMKPSDGE